MNGNDLTVGEVIPAGSMVLLTEGDDSYLGIMGLFLAKCDLVIPGKLGRYRNTFLEPDIELLSTQMTEIKYRIHRQIKTGSRER